MAQLACSKISYLYMYMYMSKSTNSVLVIENQISYIEILVRPNKVFVSARNYTINGNVS